MLFNTPLQLDWPDSSASDHSAARTFHLARLVHWLNRAGAEARLGYVLLSGDGAKEHLVDELSGQSLDVVSLKTTQEQPIPQAIRTHEGDHFNSTVYLLDGLEDGAGLELVQNLERLRDQLKKTATWVLLLVRSPMALGMLHERAPRLMTMMGHCCLFLTPTSESQQRVGVPASQLKKWRRFHRHRECVFNAVATRGESLDYWDYSRLLNSGYGALLSPLQNSVTQRMADLWQTADVEPVSEDDDPAILEAAARHRIEACQQVAREALVQILGGSYMPVDTAFSPTDPGLLADLRELARGRLQKDESALLSACSIFDNDVEAQCKVMLAIAEHRARVDDISGCIGAFDKALELMDSRGVALEVQLVILEHAVKLHTLVGQRGRARELLDILEVRVLRCGSPFWWARHKLSMGIFLMPIDGRRANQEVLEAERVFRRFGYARWANQAYELVGGENS